MGESTTLRDYSLPEWFVEPPADWVRRLREISPIVDKLAHLRFRFRAPQPDWNFPEQGVWELYSCTPKAVVSKSRAQLFEQHWSELVLEGSRVARRASVSNYQHFMWHMQGVDAQRFWVLQGHGGTPAKYTRREERILDACNAISEPFPLGFFPACPFDERSVKLILERDRLIKAELNIEDLRKMDTAEALKAEDDDAEKAHRTAFLDWWYQQIQPQKEFMQSTLFKKEEASLPPAPKELPNKLATWKETYIEHGSMPGVSVASSKAVSRAVK